MKLWELYECAHLDYLQWISIDDIGQYIAGATLCFSINKPIVLVATNIMRFIGKVFGMDLSGEARQREEMLTLIDEGMDRNNPRDFYYPLIDLSHTIYMLKTPACNKSPLIRLPWVFGQITVTAGDNESKLSSV